MHSGLEHWDFSLIHSAPASRTQKAQCFGKIRPQLSEKMSEMRLVAMSENILTC